MCRIIACNEEAYSNRYSVSLDMIWCKLPEEKQEHYLDEIREYIIEDIPQEYRFTRDEILRIVIGYKGIKQLRSVLEEATQITRILVWEPDESLFAAGCICEDISRFINDERFTFVLGRDEDALKHALSITAFDNNILHRHIYAYGKYLNPDDGDVASFIRLFEKFYIDLVSMMKFSKQYDYRVYENVLYSISVLNSNSTVNQLFECIPARDIPVIIVAAGPSLMKNCNELRRAKGRAIIVAVAHSVKTLARNGIKPDIVATMDPASPFFLDFDNKREYTLLTCVCGEKEFQQYYNGNLIFYGFPAFKALFSSPRTDVEIDAELNTGSVATDILSLFYETGFRRFILAGQDLAYGEEGVSHTEGEKEIRENDVKGSFLETEGINGGAVRTRDDWELFRKYYENRIRTDRDLSIIDATEGGALIHGSTVMKLSDAIDEYCIKVYPVDEWISCIRKGGEEEKEYIDVWFDQLEEMNLRTGVNLDRIIALNEDIIETWKDTQLWNDVFSAKCRRYDVIYSILLEGDDGVHLREYCRSDIVTYIEDALSLEGDDNIISRMEREHELFVMMREKLVNMQEYIKMIRNGRDYL